jgi:hypothetical protein
VNGISRTFKVLRPVRWAPFCLLTLAALSRVAGQEFRLDSVGTRLGISANKTGAEFHSVEAFGEWRLPWQHQWEPGWLLLPRHDLSAVLLGDGIEAARFTAGPSLLLNYGKIPLSIQGGLSPTVLTRSNFASKDIGTKFQFTSYGGLNWDITPHFRLGYRFEHMSNAHLSSSNPGINLHVLAASFLF